MLTTATVAALSRSNGQGRLGNKVTAIDYIAAARNGANFFVIKVYERVTQSAFHVNDAGMARNASVRLIKS